MLNRWRQKKSKAGAASEGSLQRALRRPRQLEQLAPCMATCASGSDIRGWIALIAQRDKLGLSEPEALTKAWQMLVDVNPFPATMGRICPHPCEAACNRKDKDGSVAINALERFLGDWALERNLALNPLQEDPGTESIGVIGAGPSGLSFAYQMRRRGYPVTIYEKNPQPGGMLRYGIPLYRLPEEILDAEIRRILDLGVALELNANVGAVIPIEELRTRHAALYLGIGAHKARKLGISGEDGPRIWTGTGYLARINSGQDVDLGKRVVVIGGGDVAVDAARTARRGGAEVTILYRRTRKEMPAIDSEVEDALREDVRIEYLVAPVKIERNGDLDLSVVVRRMELSDPDESGRRRPVPIEGSDYEIPADAVVAAISQEPDWEGLQGLVPSPPLPKADGAARIGDALWAGGDMLSVGIAGVAISHGRKAAERIHADLRGLPAITADVRSEVSRDRVKQDYYPEKRRAEVSRRPPEEWLSRPTAEINRGIGKGDFLAEASRCFSCGMCFGCEHCWMYCNPSGFTRVTQVRPGAYYSFDLQRCEGCGKCIEICPCGFLNVS